MLLKWRQVGEQGNMSFIRKVSEDDAIKLISVHDEHNEQHLVQLDPNRAEKSLVLDYPSLDPWKWNVTPEKRTYSFSAKKLYKAPISNYDAHIANQS